MSETTFWLGALAAEAERDAWFKLAAQKDAQAFSCYGLSSCPVCHIEILSSDGYVCTVSGCQTRFASEALG